jgi:hypothetical protein
MAKSTKPPRTTTFDYEKSFKQGVEFELTHMLLLSRQLHTAIAGVNEPLATVMGVSAAFAAEIYVKTLQMIDNSQAQIIHEIDDLYSALASSTKDIVKKHYNARVIKEKAKLEAFKLSTGLDYDLDSVLKNIRDSFVEWRYRFEGKPISAWNGGNVVIAFRQTCVDLDPKLATHVSTHLLN